MLKLSHSVITTTYLMLGGTSSALVSCFQQVTQSSDAVVVGIMCDVESEI